MRKFYWFRLSKRFLFEIDFHEWVFPFCFRLMLVGNDNRVNVVEMRFLCFALILLVDEYTVQAQYGENDHWGDENA